METTFGRTVETRFILRQPCNRQRNGNISHQCKQYANTPGSRHRNFPPVQHSGESSCDFALPPTPGTRSILKHQQPPQSSILTRKNYNYMFNLGVANSSGYLSDSECCLAQRDVGEKASHAVEPRPNGTASSKSKNGVSDRDRQTMQPEHNCFLTDNEDYLRNADFMHRSFCSSAERYRSIDRYLKTL